jgi:hypothetical protein
MPDEATTTKGVVASASDSEGMIPARPGRLWPAGGQRDRLDRGPDPSDAARPQLPDAFRDYSGALSRRGRAERTRSATSCSTASSARWQTAGPGTHGLTESDSCPSDEPTMPIVNRRLRGVDTADRPPVVAVGDGPSVSGQPCTTCGEEPASSGTGSTSSAAEFRARQGTTCRLTAAKCVRTGPDP